MIRNHHYMHLDDLNFDKVYSGNKTIELRLYDDKRQQINIGDFIVFVKKSDYFFTIVVKVINIHRFNNFKTLYKTLPLQKCGYFEDEVKIASPDDMHRYYSEAEQYEYGVVGIEFELVRSYL